MHRSHYSISLFFLALAIVGVTTASARSHTGSHNWSELCAELDSFKSESVVVEKAPIYVEEVEHRIYGAELGEELFNFQAQFARDYPALRPEIGAGNYLTPKHQDIVNRLMFTISQQEMLAHPKLYHLPYASDLVYTKFDDTGWSERTPGRTRRVILAQLKYNYRYWRNPAQPFGFDFWNRFHFSSGLYEQQHQSYTTIIPTGRKGWSFLNGQTTGRSLDDIEYDCFQRQLSEVRKLPGATDDFRAQFEKARPHFDFVVENLTKFPPKKGDTVIDSIEVLKNSVAAYLSTRDDNNRRSTLPEELLPRTTGWHQAIIPFRINPDASCTIMKATEVEAVYRPLFVDGN